MDWFFSSAELRRRFWRTLINKQHFELIDFHATYHLKQVIQIYIHKRVNKWCLNFYIFVWNIHLKALWQLAPVSHILKCTFSFQNKTHLASPLWKSGPQLYTLTSTRETQNSEYCLFKQPFRASNGPFKALDSWSLGKRWPDSCRGQKLSSCNSPFTSSLRLQDQQQFERSYRSQIPK